MSASLNRVEISTEALRDNFRLCRQLAGDAGIIAMVKADAYGHGMLECAQVFAHEGATDFGVAEAIEGVKLRQAGIEQPIYVFTGIYPEIIPTLFEFELTPIILNRRNIRELSRQAVQRNITMGLHLKIDAGMGRQGCSKEEFPDLVAEINNLAGLEVTGVLAHLPMSDDRASNSTTEIFAEFNSILDGVRRQLAPGCRYHLANSGALFYFSTTRLDLVRPGISLYGCHPGGDCQADPAEGQTLRPVMRFSSRITQLRDIMPGTGLGYGHSYITTRNTKLAVVPLGYANGYLRNLSGKAQVLVRGQKVPTLGRISMNLTLVDVTDIAEVQEGDEVVLLGKQGKQEITATEIATWMNTISYEVLCLFGNLNKRYYVE